MKTISAFLTLSFLTAILVIGAGCAKKPDDAQVSNDIQNKFSQDSGLSSKQLNVQAANGVVTLAGTVDNDAQREAAARQAASVPGVKTVINNLQVGAGTMASAAAPEKAEAAPPPIKKEKPSPVRKSRHSRSAKNSDVKNDTASADTQMASNVPRPAQEEQQPPVPQQPSTPPPPPPPQKVTVEQGTQLSIRLVDGIDSEKNQAGETFHATLNVPLMAEGSEAIPAGSDITGQIVDVKSAGKFAGQSLVVLQLNSITVGNKVYNLQTDQWRKEGSSRGKNTAEKVGGGAAIGAIIGAIAGGGKGAAIGAAAGGGIGGGVQAATKGQQIKLPPETALNFTLQAPLTVTKAPNPDASRQKLSDSQ